MGIKDLVNKVWQDVRDFLAGTPKDDTATTGTQAEKEAADTRSTTPKPQ